MKTPSDNLFKLVKSLDRREKIFFKIHSKNSGISKGSLSYIKLFDVIDKFEFYDKKFLLAKLKTIGFKHNLNQAKKYLAKAILHSLREYHSDISINSELQKLLLEAEVLNSKKLHELAIKTLLKAEKIAREYEIYDYLMVIQSLKVRTISAGMNIKNMEDYLNQDELKGKQYMEKLKNNIEFRNLVSNIRVIATTFSLAQENKYVDTINSILESPLLSSPKNALSFSSLKDYYNIHIAYARLSGKWDTVTYERQKEWSDYLESDKKRLGDRTEHYCAALINLMLVQIKIGRFDEADRVYEKFKQFYSSLSPKKRTKNISGGFSIGVFNYMKTQIERGNSEKALKTWEQVKELIFFNDPTTLIHGCNNLSQMYFMLGNYHYALKMVNKILDCKEDNMFDVQAMSRILLLLIHYELGNYDILPYLAKSSKLFLIKHKYFSQFEEMLISFFEKTIRNIANDQKKTEAFRQLQKKLEIVLKNTKQIPALEYFDFISWVESKIGNRPFIEVMRGKQYRI